MTITMAMMGTMMIALSCWCRLSTVEASSCYSEEVHNDERMGRWSKIVTVSLFHYLFQQAADRLQLPLLRSVHPHFHSYYVREKDYKAIAKIVMSVLWLISLPLAITPRPLRRRAFRIKIPSWIVLARKDFFADLYPSFLWEKNKQTNKQKHKQKQ